MKRHLLVVVILALVGVVVPAVSVGTQEPDVTVRIVARQLADGRVEFGLRQQQPDGSYGSEILPRVRFFPADATVDRWLRSSPVYLTSSGVAQPAPSTTTTAAPRGMHTVDQYWSQDGDTFYLVIGGISPSHTYCEVHLTLDNRRTGEWTNELPASRTQVTFEFFMPASIGARVNFDGYEIECR